MRDTGKEDKKKKVRLENGQVVSTHKKKSQYPSLFCCLLLCSCTAHYVFYCPNVLFFMSSSVEHF